MSTTLSSPPSTAEQRALRVAPPRVLPTGDRARWWNTLLPRLLLLVVLGASLVLGMAQLSTPRAVPATALATQFSADRAFPIVASVAKAPHPMGTTAHRSVETYLLGRLTALGLKPQISSMTATARFSAGVIWAGNARHIVVRIPGTANTGALLLAAHYDSVPTTGGAADCAACVATVLETVRALKAGPPLRNDVIVLLADAEEHDTLGSKGFMDQHPWAKDIRFALNLDSMGNHGPSTAYFASTGNSRVMSDYFRVAPYPLSYSFFVDPFTRITFGMDLKNYIRDGALGIDAANFRNPQIYHTRLDNAASLDRGTLQHEGSNILALARHFGNLDLRTVSHSEDAVFFNVTANRGIVYPASWSLPLAILAVILFVGVLVLGFRRSRLTVRGLLGAFALFVGATLASTAAIAVAWLAIKGATPDYQVFLQDAPYNNDLHLIAFGALAVAVVSAIYAGARRWIGPLDLALGALGVCVVLTLALSAFLPGMSYLFAWPVLAATLGFGLTLGAPQFASNPWVRAAILAVSGALTLVLVTPVVYFLFELMGRMQLISGLPLVAAAFVPAILLLALFLPHLEILGSSRRWLVPVIALVVSLGFIAGTRATSGFDSAHPRPDSVAYVLDADSGKASWVSVGAQTDNWTQQFFPHGSARTTFVPMPSEQGDLRFPALRTNAPDAGLPAPRLAMLSDRTSGGLRQLDMRVTSPRGAPNVEVIVRNAGRIAAASVDGRAVNLGTAAASPGELRIEYYGLPASGVRLTVRVAAGRSIDFTITDRSNGLPRLPGFMVPARPANTMPAMFEMRDPTIVTKSFTLKA
jgi:peptidase M28-like protein